MSTVLLNFKLLYKMENLGIIAYLIHKLVNAKAVLYQCYLSLKILLFIFKKIDLSKILQTRILTVDSIVKALLEEQFFFYKYFMHQ